MEIQVLRTHQHQEVILTTKFPDQHYSLLFLSSSSSKRLRGALHPPPRLDQQQLRKTLILLEARPIARADALLGIIKLPLGMHIVLADIKQTVAQVAGRQVCALHRIKYVPIAEPRASQEEQHSVDQHYVWMLERSLNVEGHLFGSMQYDLTQTLQNNLGDNPPFNPNYMFNYYAANKLLQIIQAKDRKSVSAWIMPVIQGYVGQMSKLIG
jgi:hypothetical protein